MKIKYEREPARFPICWDCQEPIIEGDEYYRIPWSYLGHLKIRFHHTDCFHDFYAQYMTDGGAE